VRLPLLLFPEPEGQPGEFKENLAMVKKTTIGGQALLEGLMMVGPERVAMAVRKGDGTIVVEEWPVGTLSKASRIPFIRGSVRLFHQLVTGTKTLMRSADFLEEALEKAASVEAVAPAETTEAVAPEAVAPAAAEKPEKGPGRVERFLEKHPEVVLYGSVVLGLAFSVGLFYFLPWMLVFLVPPLKALNASPALSDKIVLNLCLGLVRIALFILYLYLTSLMKDIRRVWMYHGAEHKTIHCYESGQPLTVENARTFSTRHPRCGTSFLFIVLIVSIIIFSFFTWWSPLVNLLVHLALLPFVAGVAFEIIRWAGRHDRNLVSRILSAPGLALQALTTREPDDAMLEVAIRATERVIPERKDADVW
jgi:uncharacterized protein YqhQ